MVVNTNTEAVLDDLGAWVITYQNLEEAYKALIDGRLDAVVQDSPSLYFFSENKGKNKVDVVGNEFAPHIYAMAVPQ